MTSVMPTRPYDNTYLKDYSREHVFYEFDMFLWSAQLCGSKTLLNAPSAVDATRLNNALVETFVIHLRNVIDFLFLKDPRPTDIVAADFCASGEWQPTISDTLDLARTRANKETAHLTTARIGGAPASKGWDFASLLAELRPLMRLFVTKAQPARLASNVVDVVR